MGLFSILKGALPHADDIMQLINTFTRKRDAGALSLLGQITAPASAPTVTLSSGSLNGSYQWGVYWITGVEDGVGGYNVTGRTTPSPYSTAQTLTNQQGTVSIAALTVPTGVVGWGAVRNQNGGSTFYEVPGSEQFMSSSGALPQTYIDDTADANLVTDAPTSNSTGTYWAESTPLGQREMLPDYDQYASNVGDNQIYTLVQLKRPDGTLYLASTLSNPNANGNYQTDTWQFYDATGTNVILTHVWSLTWDSNSKIVSKVMTS